MFNYTQNGENIPVNSSLQFIRAECSTGTVGTFFLKETIFFKQNFV